VDRSDFFFWWYGVIGPVYFLVAGFGMYFLTGYLDKRADKKKHCHKP